MSMIDVTSLTAPSLQQPALQQPRAVSDTATREFREALGKPDCASEACAVQPPTSSGRPFDLEFSFDKAVTPFMPSLSGSPAETAMGLLRMQFAVLNTSVAIEMTAKTTQNVSQGVQTLTK